jgi:hypothetical protein
VKQILYFISYLAILLVFNQCESRFDFKEDRSSVNQLIIAGYINQSNGPYMVEIRQTSFLGTPPTPFLNAKVVMFDDGGSREAFQDNQDGTYTCEGNVVKGFPGRSYHIEVLLPDGRSYRSKPDRMPSIGSNDQMHWRQVKAITTTNLGTDVETNGVEVGFTTRPESTDPVFLLWNGEETYEYKPTDFPEFNNVTPPPCYITEPIGVEKINIFTTVGYTPDTFRVNRLFARTLDKSFATKHIFSLYQLSISEENYEYMKSIESLAENVGSLFDTPPGRALGNIEPLSDPEEPVQGFFQAVLMDTTRIAVFPSELKNIVFPFSDACIFLEGFEDREFYSDTCLDCLLLPRSSIIRPGYWVNTN